MKNLKYWGVMVAAGLLIGVVLWWAVSELKDRNEPLNQADAFVYSNNGMLYWFELTSRKGEVKGNLHQQKLIEEIGKPPMIEEEEYPLTGKTTETGYVFRVNNGERIITFDARFSGPHLSVQKHGEKDNILYNPVDQQELNEYKESLLNYHTEEHEDNRLRKFFSDLRKVYGYLYTSDNGSYQLFIKIDEALLEGELSGSLLMMTKTGNKSQPYEETRYSLNGVTDGIKVEFFTKVDGNETKLEGHFHGDATAFNLSFWTIDKRLKFHAVTEEEFKQSYDHFITKSKINDD